MNNRNKKRNVILGSVSGLNIEHIKPFISSLKKSGFDGELCLFIDRVSDNTIDYLSKYNTQYEINLSPFRTDNRNISIHCYRYLLYHTHLLNNKEYNKEYSIMLTDVRDVIFQNDPFDFEFNGLCCFLEDKRKTINSCPINSSWLHSAFGVGTLKEIGSYNISCSGVTIGSYSSIIPYLDKMVYFINKLGPKANITGIDQGIHNYIVHKKLVDYKFFENLDGPVLTMGYTDPKSLHFNNDRFIINNNGNVINILHQYDRHRDIMYNIMAKLSLLKLETLKYKIGML